MRLIYLLHFSYYLASAIINADISGADHLTLN